jgi:hypothetical protein
VGPRASLIMAGEENISTLAGNWTLLILPIA